MENKNIIILLFVIIVILAAVLGYMLLNPTSAKEPTKIKITSDKEQFEEDGQLSVKLTDLNNTAISKEIVNITITNSKGKVVVDNAVKTDSKGKAKLDLDLKKGKYNVTVSYGGNENYTGNNTTQKLTIKEITTSQTSSSSGWTTTAPGGDTGSTISIYHDGKGHKYVTRYSADGSSSEDGIVYDEDDMITS